MKKINKFLLLFSLFPITGVVSTSCASDGIVFANYESYMSDDVMADLKNSYKISFLPYETNEEIENKFEGYYDLAVPTTYEAVALYEKGLLEKIDWKKFNIHVDGKLITNGIQARDCGIFTDSIIKIITELDDEYHTDHIYDSDVSILDYGIPYFLQSFSFAYKGDPIPDLDSAQNWNDICEQINSYKTDLDPRFTPNKERKIAVVDDSRSMFGIAHTMNSDTVNPENETSISYFKGIYKQLTDNFKKNYLYFNTDSGSIISTFAKHYPNGASSTIAYNGDILYAAQGGGLYGPAPDGTLHYCKLNKTLLALDMVVINKNAVKNERKKDNVYDIVKRVCLSGSDDSDSEVDPYVYDSFTNFDFIQYTDPLSWIHDYVMNRDNNYFSGAPDQIQLYEDIFDITPEMVNVKLIEQQIKSSLAKSNMHWAYSAIKNDL